MRMLTGLADDIKVSIYRGTAEITCVKKIAKKTTHRRTTKTVKKETQE